MNSTNSIDQKAYLFDSRDGLLDIFTGGVFLAFGIGMLTENVWLAGILPALLYPLWISAKERITAPRLRYLDEMSDDVGTVDTARIRSALVGMMALLVGSVLFGFVFFALFSSGDYMPQVQAWFRSNFPLAFGGFISLLLAGIALIFRTARFLVYAAIALTAFVLSQLFNLPMEYAMLTIAGLMFITGWVILLRLLSTHPSQD